MQTDIEAPTALWHQLPSGRPWVFEADDNVLLVVAAK